MIGQLSYKAWMLFKCTDGNVHLFLFSQVMWSFSVVNVVIGTMYYIKLNSCVCISPLIPRYNKNSCRSVRTRHARIQKIFTPAVSETWFCLPICNYFISVSLVCLNFPDDVGGGGGEGSVLQTSWSAHAHVRWLKKLGSCADIKKGRRRCPNLPIPLKNSNLFKFNQSL